MIVNVKVKRNRDQQDAIGPQHTTDFLEAAPEALNVLEGIQSHDGPETFVRKGKLFDVGQFIHARTGANVNAEVLAAGEERPQFGEFFLSRHLISADFENRSGQRKRFGGGAGHPVEEAIHRRHPAQSRRARPGKVSSLTKLARLRRASRSNTGWRFVSTASAADPRNIPGREENPCEGMMKVGGHPSEFVAK